VRNILLFGHRGQLAFELQRTLSTLGRVTVVGRETTPLRADLARPDGIAAVIRHTRPDIIVNAAAYTAVDAAESDRDAAMAVNGVAPGVMAEEAARRGALLVHYSTDYIFDGTGRTPYTETDPPAPLGVYGETKLAGEQAVRHSGVAHLILRTAWVYGARGRNFLNTIRRLAGEREELRIVDDQHGAPTWSRCIAEATAQILAQGARDPERLRAYQGTYHLSNAGECTWYDFAAAIVDAMDPSGRRVSRMEPISTGEFPTPARRPAYSVLSNRKLNDTFGIALPHWRHALALCLEEDEAGRHPCE
jgi:dTDP-4-dehydrorhamnose reductase